MPNFRGIMNFYWPEREEREMILPHPKQGQLLSSSSWSQHPNILSYNINKPKREMKAAFIFLSLATGLKKFITGAKGKG